MGCWQGRDILALMVRMKKIAVEERRLPMASLLNTICEEDCPTMKEVNKGRAREVVLYQMDEIPLLVDAFAKNSKNVGEILNMLRIMLKA